MNPSTDTKDTASEADIAEIENLRKRMVSLLQRMDRVLIPLRAMHAGIMPGEPDYPKMSDEPENIDFDDDDEPQYAEPTGYGH